jgi:hypothetical protein
VDTDLRASLIASGAAAVLSILVGIISGVEFLPLMLRALLGGLAFGGVVFLALFLLRRFLPELFGAQEEAEKPLGGNVDIVLPGEVPEPISGAEARDEAAEDVEAVVDEAPPRRPGRAAAAAPADDGGDEAEAGLSEDVSPFVADSLLDGPPADEDEGAAVAAAAAAAAKPLRNHGGLDDLDVLPDLESLSDGFSTSAEADGTSVHEYGESERRPKEGGSRGDADPAVLAQAVRTLLKRDQER